MVDIRVWIPQKIYLVEVFGAGIFLEVEASLLPIQDLLFLSKDRTRTEVRSFIFVLVSYVAITNYQQFLA